MSENSKPGRPSGYDPKYCNEILEYFGKPPYSERLTKIYTKKGDVVEIPQDVANDVPTFAGFASRVGVHRDTLHEWCKNHAEFSDAYKRAKDFQENFLVINGNKGLINSPFAIFTAKNVLGWRDKQPGEADVVVNNFSDKSVEDLQVRARELAAEILGDNGSEQGS